MRQVLTRVQQYQRPCLHGRRQAVLARRCLQGVDVGHMQLAASEPGDLACSPIASLIQGSSVHAASCARLTSCASWHTRSAGSTLPSTLLRCTITTTCTGGVSAGLPGLSAVSSWPSIHHATCRCRGLQLLPWPCTRGLPQAVGDLPHLALCPTLVLPGRSLARKSSMSTSCVSSVRWTSTMVAPVFSATCKQASRLAVGFESLPTARAIPKLALFTQQLQSAPAATGPASCGAPPQTSGSAWQGYQCEVW